MVSEKFIYICSPFKGNTTRNIRRAKEYSKWVYNQGHIPICVHIYLENATGLSEKKGDREELLRLGKEFLYLCEELWVFGDNISDGMDEEIKAAQKMLKKVKVIQRNEYA